jgi:hypothetical protein
MTKREGKNAISTIKLHSKVLLKEMKCNKMNYFAVFSHSFGTNMINNNLYSTGKC